MAKKYKPFAIGSQYAEWTTKNCGSCKKGYDEKRNKFRCDYECTLAYAYCDDGQITEEMAKSIGYLDNKDCIIWECPRWVRR